MKPSKQSPRARRASAQPPEALTTASSAPGSILDDAEMGRQLTAQYHRAVSGMRDVLLFGAMLWQVEESCVQRGHNSATRGPTAKGTGLKGWLEQHAPEISRPTAYRFLGIAKSVAEEYESVVGARIAKSYDLPALVLADTAALPEPAKLKQGKLFDYVAGTSQRSLLDRFKGDARAHNGGKRERPNGTKRRTAVEKDFDDNEHRALQWYQDAFGTLRLMNDSPQLTYQHLPDVELANVADILKLLAKHADEICRSRRVVPSKLRDWDNEGEGR